MKRLVRSVRSVRSVSLPLAQVQLDDLRIASPCSMRWEDMAGDARARHCGSCRLNVYDISEMTQAEASELILKHEGHLCVRLHKRADGTVITKNCPVGMRRVRHAAIRLCGSLAAALALGVGSVAAMGERLRGRTVKVSETEPYLTLTNLLRTPPTVVPAAPPTGGVLLMGELVWVPPARPVAATASPLARGVSSGRSLRPEDAAINDELNRVRVPTGLGPIRLEDAIVRVQDASGIRIEVRWPELEAIGVNHDTQIVLARSDPKAANVLDRIANQASRNNPRGSVSWMIQDGAVVLGGTCHGP